MPGLLRGVARTAVVAGTATAVSNRVSRRQQGRWAAQAQPSQGYQQQPQGYQQQGYQEAPPPPQPAPTTSTADDMTNKIDQLKQLGELKAQGVLTEAEFEEQKRRLLA
ncbi:SHOCT domain-containing protein [Streptomyces sp. NPDC101209]|uniref:SHOCT domain-containing protein n=1 Tax=Streptomyces sp. NPDC101209 TaxID=3366129 RepID=UPI00380468CC